MTDIVQTAEAVAEELFPTPVPVIKYAFHNSLGSCKYIFKDGTEAPFTGGIYYTDNEAKVAELKAEIAAGHPYISVKAGEETVNVAIGDPLEAVRRAAAAEAIARYQASLKDNDMGSTDQSGKLEGIGNSTTVAAAAGDSTSTDANVGGTVAAANPVTSSLAALKAGLATSNQ
jgi:hypothetical protein